jgi:hypothetical protein
LFSRAGPGPNRKAPPLGHGVGWNNGLERHSKQNSGKFHDSLEKFVLVLVIVGL